MTYTPTPAQIAARLSKSQRKALLAVWIEGQANEMSLGCGTATIKALANRGLCARVPVRDGVRGWWMLSVLGLAVRAEVEKEAGR